MAPRELTRWRVTPGDVEVELAATNRTRFLGALVHNAFTEDYEVQLEVRTQPVTATVARLPATSVASAPSGALPTGERLSYTTRFVMPFIEHGYGFSAGYQNDPLIELVFAKPAQVREIEARLNGAVVPVQRYRTPQKLAMETFFIELADQIKPGPVELTLNVRY